MTPQEIVDKINSTNSEVPEEVYYKLNELLDNHKEDDALFYLQNYFRCTDDIAQSTLMLYKETVYACHKKIIDDARSRLTPEQIALNNAAWRNMPRCPTCTSINIQKIGEWERFASVSTLGLLSNKINKTFKCKNCGYMW